MKLIDQKAKKIMEDCKVRAKKAGLEIHTETLEYIITNQELLELFPKFMIPTLYDYWVDDVGVIQNKWMYEVYPHNPYLEVVINTRPVISFFNDNNADWLNVMIFYHVLAHIDFFHNNIFFQTTWKSDFYNQALSDKRLINKIREEKGANKRWVDYVIEFARSVDNLVGYYSELEKTDDVIKQNILLSRITPRVNFYFNEFLKKLLKDGVINLKFYYDEIERYNECQRKFDEKSVELIFFDNIQHKFPEFNSIYGKHKQENKKNSQDVLQYLLDHSEFLKRTENLWMRDIIQVIRRTSLYFQPQLRTKICNEGWASFWHERLFLTDERIRGHEVDYALINSKILVQPRLNFNPYIFGKNMFEFIEYLAKKGRLSAEYQLIRDKEMRENYDKKLGDEYGKNTIFEIRRNCNDFLLVNFLSDENFQDFVDTYKLFVAGRRFNPKKGVFEIYIKSRSGKDYRKMILNGLYHPPYILINQGKFYKDCKAELYLNHVFEGRTLVTEYIPAVLMGLSYLCGGKKVALETTEFEIDQSAYYKSLIEGKEIEYTKIRVLYTCEKKKINKSILYRYKKEEVE